MCHLSHRARATVSVAVLVCATSACAPYAYIPHRLEGAWPAVSIVDTGSNSVVGSVSGLGPLVAVAVNPAERTWLYVSRFPAETAADGVLHVIDTRTNSLFTSLTIVEGDEDARRYGYVLGIAVAPDGSRVYASATLLDAPSFSLVESFVAVIDTATHTVIDTIGVDTGPFGLAVAPSGARVYVANNYAGTVSVIDTATNTVLDTFDVGGCLTGVAVSPDSSRVYVSSGYTHTLCVGGFEDAVFVIDATAHAVVTTVPLEPSPTGLVVTPDGSRVYVASGDTDTVSVIDTATNNVVGTIGVGSAPFGVDVVPLGTHVYVANGEGTVSVIDTATNLVVDTVVLPAGSQALGRFIVVPLVPIVPDASPGTAVPSLRPDDSPDNGVRSEYETFVSRHGAEIARLLVRAPDLRARAEALARRLGPGIAALLDGHDVTVNAADLHAIDAWLEDLRTRSGPRLATAVGRLLDEIRSPAALRRRGIDIR